jgi:hypothetical protein
MRSAALERWRVFAVWLGSGLSGIGPDELRLTLGPVWALLPLARQVAQALGPWLLPLLAERQRRGLAALPEEVRLWLTGALDEETRMQPFKRREMRQGTGWLRWWLEAELRRLVRLAEAPEQGMQRPGWLAWEVRYWTLAVSLARIGQLYAALEQRQGIEQAQQMFKGALALVWHQAMQAHQAA